MHIWKFSYIFINPRYISKVLVLSWNSGASWKFWCISGIFDECLKSQENFRNPWHNSCILLAFQKFFIHFTNSRFNFKMFVIFQILCTFLNKEKLNDFWLSIGFLQFLKFNYLIWPHHNMLVCNLSKKMHQSKISKISFYLKRKNYGR